MDNIDWNKNVYTVPDVDTAYNNFIHEVQTGFNASFPLTQLSIRGSKDKKWMTRGLKKSSKRKNYLYRHWLKSGQNDDKIKYKMYKTVFDRAAKAAEIKYYKDKFDNRSMTIKKVWQQINAICSYKKSKTKIDIPKLIVDKKEITDPQDICNKMNDYFSNIGVNLSKELPQSTHCFTHYMPAPMLNSMFCSSITYNDIVCEILKLNVTKSAGNDGIGPMIVRENSLSFAAPLLHIYNMSLSMGIVPAKLKLAKIIPVYKKGALTDACNYRPISLLSIFDKIFEKLVCVKLMNYLTKYNIFYEYQFGFRQSHSTILALIDEIYKSLDDGNFVISMYFDLQKAFDTVDHDILLAKLNIYGIRGNMYNWFKNYLSDRLQFTSIGPHCSNITSIKCGVPQGSVLGPILFLIYMNDITFAATSTKIKLFADDTNMFVGNKSITELNKQCNTHLKNLNEWFLANKLSLNVSKTCFTLFKPHIQNDLLCNMNLAINNIKIEPIACCKYLGLLIDEKMKWKDHIKFVEKKILKFVSIFYKIRDKLPKKCLKSLYFALVYPHILYGIELYANTNKSYLNKLHVLNNKILRTLQRKHKKFRVASLYEGYNTLPINLLHERQLLLFIHKCIHHNDKLPSIFAKYHNDNTDIHDHDTRQKTNLHVALHSTSFGQRCVNYKGGKQWNSLPNNLKTERSTLKFKKMVYKHLLSFADNQ